MDIASVIGLLLGFGSIIFAAQVSHANMALFYQKYEAFVLVFGGTLGAAFLSFPLDTCFSALKNGFAITFLRRDASLESVIDRFARLADTARREGLLTLENQIRTLSDPSAKRAIEMIVDGQDADIIRSVMETETDIMVARMRDHESFFTALGGYSPTLGIIGTVLGLISMLGKLGELTSGTGGNVAGSIGGETAAAFIATFLGVFFANLLWLPIAGKIRARIARLELERELLTEAVLMLQAGNSPTSLRRRLGAFVYSEAGAAIPGTSAREDNEPAQEGASAGGPQQTPRQTVGASAS